MLPGSKRHGDQQWTMDNGQWTIPQRVPLLREQCRWALPTLPVRDCNMNRAQDSSAGDHKLRMGVIVPAVLLLFCAAAPGAAAQAHGQPESALKQDEIPTGPANAEEIKRLVEDLGAADYPARTYAMRRLCAIGMPAAQRLCTAAESANTEQALRARKLLTTFERVLFAGVEVKLAAESITAWDDPLHLRVTLTNRSAYPAKVPFEADAARRAELPAEARQVGDVLDLAELLTVRDPAGQKLDLRVDELNAREEVSAALRPRLTGGPITVLAPGQEVTLECRGLNRGWARYPLFERGTYTFILEYVPPWEDEVLAAQLLGRVRSNELTVKVAQPAPEQVARAGASSSLMLTRAGQDFVVRLTNHWDLPVLVNRNFGVTAPLAEGCWEAWAGGNEHDLVHLGREHTSWEAFTEEGLVEVAAGASLELARITAAELQATVARQVPEAEATDVEIFFRYSNVCSRTWQQTRGKEVLGNPQVPAVLRTLLPASLLSAQHSSNVVRLTASVLQGSDAIPPALEPNAPAP